VRARARACVYTQGYLSLDKIKGIFDDIINE